MIIGSMDAAQVVTSGLPCGEPCPSATPICDQERQLCLECSADRHCRGASAKGPYCADNRCVGCMMSEDCGTPKAAHCDGASHTCVGCENDSDCVGVVDPEGGSLLPVCDGQGARCVQCSGNRYGSCGKDDAGTALVCDVAKQTCSMRAEASASLCSECVSDAHCQRGMRCVKEVFEGRELGNVCLWAPGTGEPNAPVNCNSESARPFSIVQSFRGLDGEDTDVCALSASTCAAWLHFGLAGCTTAGGTEACGHPEFADGYCRQKQPGIEMSPLACSLPCGSTVDCPVGFACNRNNVPSVCDLVVGTCHAASDCDDGKTCVDGLCVL